MPCVFPFIYMLSGIEPFELQHIFLMLTLIANYHYASNSICMVMDTAQTMASLASTYIVRVHTFFTFRRHIIMPRLTTRNQRLLHQYKREGLCQA